jgi:DNA-binding NarL/FixJ family response regulator
VNREPYSGRKLRVLIADDSAAIRESLSCLIARMENVEVIGFAHTGPQALDLIRTLKPDVVTLDIHMPEMTGIKVLETLQPEKLPVDIVVFTGLIEDEYRRKCLGLGAKYFFHKSAEFELVIDVLAEHAARLGASAPGSSLNPS